MGRRCRVNKLLAVFSVVLVSAFSVTAFGAETYKLDPVHTSVVFRIKHLDVAFAYGRFNETAGSFTFDESAPSKSAIEVQINVKEVDTAAEKRDKHLRSPDFFNVKEHPLATFKSTSVRKIDQETYEVAGMLTLLGKSKPITLKAHGTGSGKDPWGNYRRGFESSLTIKRSDFGMTFMLSGLSDEVLITVSLEGIRQ